MRTKIRRGESTKESFSIGEPSDSSIYSRGISYEDLYEYLTFVDILSCLDYEIEFGSKEDQRMNGRR